MHGDTRASLVHERARTHVGEDDLERTGHLLWAMESFTDPESVRPTMALMVISDTPDT